MTVSTIAKPQVGPDLQRAEVDRPRQPLDPQTSAACPRTSSDVQSSLKIRILHIGKFRWTNPNGGQNGGQTHSQTKRRGSKDSRPQLPSDPSVTRSAAGLNSSSTNSSPHCPDHSASRCSSAALRDRERSLRCQRIRASSRMPNPVSRWIGSLADYVNRLTKARAVSATSRQPLSMVRA